MDGVIAEIKILKIDIAVITETKRKGQGSERMGHYDFFLQWNNERWESTTGNIYSDKE